MGVGDGWQRMAPWAFLAAVIAAGFLAIDSEGVWTMPVPSCRTNPAVPISVWLLFIGPLGFYLPVCGHVLLVGTDPTCAIVAAVLFSATIVVPRRWPSATVNVLVFVLLVWLSAGALVVMAASQG